MEKIRYANRPISINPHNIKQFGKSPERCEYNKDITCILHAKTIREVWGQVGAMDLER